MREVTPKTPLKPFPGPAPCSPLEVELDGFSKSESAVNEDRPTSQVHSPQRPEIHALAAQWVEDLAQRWQRGERPTAREYLDRHPELCDHPELAVRFIHEEVCLRQEHGEAVDYQAMLDQYPQWHEELALVLDCHQLLQEEMALPKWPEPGDQLGHYRLLHELGRGGQGRVFLALQINLAHRPVVLKVSQATGQEHRSLARLQHTAIVPLYAAEEDEERHLRILCMPWFGGRSLDEILDQIQEVPFAQRNGSLLSGLIDRPDIDLPEARPTQMPARELLERAEYVQAICWIGACLADALHHAHERGLVHLDIKPGNVLLATDGQPMLLDFHLAQAPIASSSYPEWLGGTAAYASPEQQLAIQAVKDRQATPKAIDRRSDLYSLGLVLYELLGGTVSRPQSNYLPPLHKENQSIPRGLSDIVQKCMAEDPDLRYDTAAALATDLRCHLSHRPLKGAPNRSWKERWQKWRRRRPWTFPLLFMLVAVVAAALTLGTVGIAHIRHQHQRAEMLLQQGNMYLAREQYDRALDAFQQSQSIADQVPQGGSLSIAASTRMATAKRGIDALAAHQLAQELRLLSGSPLLAQGGSASLSPKKIKDQWQQLWSRREKWQRSPQKLSPEREKQFNQDLLDLALIYAELLLATSAPEERHKSCQKVLTLLDQTEELYGTTLILLHLREHCYRQLGERALAREAAQQAAKHPPRNAWEQCLLGRSALQQKRYKTAAEHLDRAIEENPQSFWAHFYRGLCALSRKKPQDAIQAFSVCIALNPTVAESYYNRGLAYDAAQQPDRAIREYSLLLSKHPGMAPALLQRGLLYAKQGEKQKALEDLESALHQGGPPDVAHYHRARIYIELKEWSRAKESLDEALKANPDYPPARELKQSLTGDQP